VKIRSRKTQPPNLDESDETWGRLQMAYRARKQMLRALAEWTEEIRELETQRYGYPSTRRVEVGL